MLRTDLGAALKAAMLAKETRTVSTLRLILSALKDRDIAARPRGITDGIPDAEIPALLQGMIKQRRESITMYRQGNRPELAEQEEAEIAVIERFLPSQMTEAEIGEAVKSVVAELGATTIKDMGRSMAALRERFGGRMDFAKAGPILKALLG